MSRASKILLISLGALVLVAGGLFGYYRWQVSKALNTSGPSDQSVATDEADTNVNITKNVLVGKFVRGEKDKIVFEQNGEKKELATTSNFSFVCTTQIVGSEAVLEYGKVITVTPISPSDIATKIDAGESILVMLNSGDGKANSVVSSRCGTSF